MRQGFRLDGQQWTNSDQIPFKKSERGSIRVILPDPCLTGTLPPPPPSFLTPTWPGNSGRGLLNVPPPLFTAEYQPNTGESFIFGQCLNPTSIAPGGIHLVRKQQHRHFCDGGLLGGGFRLGTPAYPSYPPGPLVQFSHRQPQGIAPRRPPEVVQRQVLSQQLHGGRGARKAYSRQQDVPIPVQLTETTQGDMKVFRMVHVMRWDITPLHQSVRTPGL